MVISSILKALPSGVLALARLAGVLAGARRSQRRATRAFSAELERMGLEPETIKELSKSYLQSADRLVAPFRQWGPSLSTRRDKS